MLIHGVIASSRLAISGAFESIATVTASGGETSLTFSSIPSTYKHLQIRGIGRNSTNDYLQLKFNSDSGANYARHYLRGSGTAASVGGAISQTIMSRQGEYTTATSVFAPAIIDIIDYANTSKYKTVRTFSGADDNGSGPISWVYLASGLWQSTAAISTIQISSGSGTYYAGTTYALYGIKGA